MADGPEPGITGEDGAALSLEGGGGVVESCGEVKCGPCDGGADPCCICVDSELDQNVPAPCRPPYENPRDKWCNGARKCCCGTSVRVVWTRNASYFKRTDTPGVGFKQNDGYWQERAEFEIAVKYGPDGKCIGFEYTYLKYDLKYFNHEITEDHESDTPPKEDHDPNSIKNLLIGPMGNAQVLCRPEPVELAVALLGGGNSPYSPNTGTWASLMQAGGCNGESKQEDNTPPVTFLNITRWRSSASCRNMEIVAEVDNEFANQFSYGTEDVTQTVTMGLEVLEDECCPKPEGPYAPYGGVNPAPPLIPLDGREDPGAVGDRCLRCGERMRGEKCLWCGWCVSCGG